MASKIRLVRCPKCRQVLTELPEFPLYQCGGCGTVLQAKSRKKETDGTDLSSGGTGSVARTQQDGALDRSLNHELSRESLPDKDNLGDQEKHRDRDDVSRRGQSDGPVSNGLSTSSEANLPESTEDEEQPWKHEESKSPLSQDPKIYDDGSFPDSDEKWTGSRKLSDETPCLTEFISHEAQLSTGEATEDQEDRTNLDQGTGVSFSEGGESIELQQEGENFIDRAQKLPENKEQENDSPSSGGERKEGTENEAKTQNCSAEQNGEVSQSGADSSAARIVSHENDIAPLSSKPSDEVDDSILGLSASRRSDAQENLNASVENSIVASQIVPVDFVYPDDDSMRKTGRSRGSFSSVDTPGSSPLADPSSELSMKDGDMANYPAARSYYAYYDTESSYDDQTPEHVSHPLQRKIKDADHNSTAAMRRRDGGYREDDLPNSEPERSYQESSSSVLRGTHRRFMRDSYWNHYRYPETERHGLTSGNGLPFTHRTGSPSIYNHYLPPPHPGFHSPGRHSYSESDEMDLLRTVYELKDQLNRMQLSNIASNGRLPGAVMEENRAPYYHDSLLPERETYADLSHMEYHLHNQAKQSNASRLAFPGEAADYRHRVKCSCLHYFPTDRHHCSSHSPSHCTQRGNGYCAVHTGHNISSSSSPHHCASCDDRRLLREKYLSGKRHLRPVAGGAPLVPCYHCSELLQLPADFLLFKKKYHQLQCGECREVMKFSLLKGNHLVPYLPDAERNPVPASDSHCQDVEPGSCHNDNGRDTYDSNMSPGSSQEDRRTMKPISKESGNKKRAVSSESIEPVGPSSMEKSSSASSSTSSRLLHRLMGYSSISQVHK